MALGRARGEDPAHPSGPPARDDRRSFVDEQYPALVRNSRPRPSDLRRLRREAEALVRDGGGPLISVLVPLSDPRPEVLGRSLDSVVGQAYPNWELIACYRAEGATGSAAEGILSRYGRLDGRVRMAPAMREDGTRDAAVLSNAALSQARGEFVCLLDGGDELSPDALVGVAEALRNHPEADLLYSDEDAIDERGGRSSPRFKPGWSPDLLLSTNYVGRLAVFRRALMEELGGYREDLGDAHEHDLLLRATERTDRIYHLPRVLYHRRMTVDPSEPFRDGNGDEGPSREVARRIISEALERRGMGGAVEDGLLPGTFRARPRIKGEPKVSIIMPTKDHAHLLKSCIGSIEGLTEYPNYEILIVDNDSTEPATLEYLAETPHRVIPFKEKYNHPKINNLGVSLAEGEYVLLLNDDTEVIGGGWLGAMLEHAQRPEVGAVGARLLYPDGRVQHAGVMTGAGHAWFRGVATHPYRFYPPEAPGHLGTLLTTTDYSAVTAACVLMRKAVYEEVGGLDEENLPVSFDDVDLCLRIRERGYLVVYTPYAELYHYETATRPKYDDPAEIVYMRERWGEVLDSDPYLNPNFSKGTGDFNLRADLLRPRVLRPEPRTDNPENPSESQLILMSHEERDPYMRPRYAAARDSSRVSLVPRSSAGITETTLPKILERAITVAETASAPAPRNNGQAHESKQPEPRRSVRTEQFIWMFGSPRTGSTWLSRMMAELENQERWNEPYAGLLFGSFLYERLEGNRDKLLNNPSFIFAEPYRKVWLESVKNFVVEGATARYPNLSEDHYLVVKEPNGSVGAGLLMEATPDSRMIFLIRDSKDVIASRLDATRKGAWTRQNREFDTPGKLNAFTKHLAEEYLKVVSQVESAYEAHPGKKTLVRYEDLRRDTLGTLKAMYAALEIGFDEAQLEAAVAKHSWEQIPDTDKGSGKFYRKAQPGSWRDDLSSEQIRIIEDITGPILSRYY